MKSSILPILILICSILFPATLAAADKVDLSNYAYSIYLGSGVYSAADRDVGTLNIPLKFQLIPMREGYWGLNLNLPFAIGIYNFKGLPLDGPVPDRVETLTILPGIELPRQITNRWRLTPFVDLGAGKNLSGNNLTMVYGFGVKSLYEFSWKNFDMELANRFLYAGNEAQNTRLAHNFRAMETIITANHDLPFKIDHKPLVTSLYLGNYLYSNLAFIRFNNRDFNINIQYETGVTLAIKKPAKFWFVSNPRIGVGYRFGDDLSVFRLVFGSPF